MNIAIVAPSYISAGVATVFHNLHKGLVNEGFHVDTIKLNGGNFPLLSTVYHDVLKARHLMKYDLVLYLGSTPWPSHILARLSGIPIALFLHGYVYHELFHEMLYGAGLRNKMGAAIIATMLKTAVSFNTIDLYICHSLTVCEANKISDSFVLLPQWIFPEELKPPKTTSGYFLKNNAIRILTYGSYASSPRLLNTRHLIFLAQAVRRMVKRKFELIIVDPKGYVSSFGPVKIIRPKPHQEFLSLLASADLYIERNIDEELRLVALEAMTLGTPVAKLTHPMYWNRQDYTEEDLIIARSFKSLAKKIAEYVNNLEHSYYYYSKHGKEFVLTKRTWDAVKKPLLGALKFVIKRNHDK